MKRNFTALLFLSFLLLSNLCIAQFTYTEGFESGSFPPAGWTSGSNTLWVPAQRGVSPSCAVHTGANMLQFTGAGNAGSTSTFITPSFSLAAVGTNTATVSLWIYRDNGSALGDSISVYINTSASLTGATYINRIARYRALSQPDTKTSNGWYQYTFNIPAAFNTASNYLIFKGTSLGGENIYVDDIAWTAYPAAAAGVPSTGTASAGSATACSSGAFGVELTGINPTGGVTIQWQSSATGIAGSFTDIAGATNTTYIASGITAATYYQANVTNGASTATSNIVKVGYTSSCVCVPSYVNSPTTTYEMTNFSLTGYNSTSISDNGPSAESSAGYDDETSTVGISLQQGGAYSGSVTNNFGAATYTSIWIDYNDDGVFSASERVSGGVLGNTTCNNSVTNFPFTINVAYNAALGSHRMRVRNVFTNGCTPPSSIDPCNSTANGVSYYYGVTRDYLVTIATLPPCSGTPTAGTASASSGTACVTNSFTLNLTGFTLASGIGIQWQSSTTGAAGSFTDITGATTTPYTVTGQAITTYYQAVVNCSGGNPVTSNAIQVQESSCYCIPTYTTGCQNGDYVNKFTLSGVCNTIINDSNTTCPNTASYSNRTAETPIKMIAGLSYNGTISSGTTNDYARIWIDFNNDGTFSATEQVATVGNYNASSYISVYPGTTSYSITIPSGINPGSYRMRVRLISNTLQSSIDPCNNYTYGETVDYTVNVVPPVPTVNSNSPVCLNGTLSLSATDAITGTYYWTGPNNFTSTSATPTIPNITLAGAGAYTVTLTSNTVTSCAVATTVEVDTLPPATTTPAGSISFCAGNSVTLNANAGANYSWLWLVNGNSTGITTQSYTTGANGSYRVVVSNGICPDTSAAVIVTVYPLPVASVTTGTPTTVCAGDSVVLHAGTGTGYTYQWQDNSININGATGIDYTALTSGTYRVVVTSANNCVDTSAVTAVTVNPVPDSMVTVSGATNFCAGGSVTVTAVACTGCTYQWYNGAASILGSTNNVYTASATGTYRALITNSSSCSDTTIATPVSVHPLPAVTVAAGGPTTFCANDSVVLTATADTTVTYQWLNGTTALAGATNSTYKAAASGTYRVVATSFYGCTDTSNATSVTVNALPAAVITTTTPTTFCQGGSVILYASPVTGVTYQWLDNNNATSNTTFSYTANTSGSYRVVETNASGCVDTSAATIVTVDTLPVVSVTPAGTVSICNGSSVVLTADPATGYIYQWYNNANAAIGGATTSTYTATTTNIYRVKVTDGNGCSDTSNHVTVIVNALPNATVTPSGSQSICTGNTLTLTANTGANLTYQWNINGAAVLDSTNHTYIADTGGSYTVTVTNSSTGCSRTSTATVLTINPLPIVSIAANGPTTFCQNSNVVLQATTTTSTGSTITSYRWYNGTTLVATTTTPSYTASAAGTYTAVVTNSNGCVSLASNGITITVNPLPNSSITPNGPTTVCPDDSVLLNANPTTGVTYQWSDANGNIPGATNSTFLAGPGTYTLTTTNSFGCSQTSATTTIAYNPATAMATAAGPTTVCNGNNVPIDANTGNNLTYQWYNYGTSIPAATNSVYDATVTGDYSVIVTNVTGCKDTSDTVAVVVNPLPVVTIAANGPTTFCNGLNVVISATSNMSVTYQWYQDGILIPGATDSFYTATTSGDYTVVVTNVYGCTSASDPITVIVNVLPAATITPEGPTTVCYGGSVTLDANTGAGYTYQWQLNGVNIPGATDATYTATTSGNYVVIVTNSTGCVTMSAPTSVIINPQPVLVADNPTSFCWGSTATMHINAGNTGTAFTYQWQRNGANIPGATNASYNTYIAGSYTCVATITNVCSEPTQAITLTVRPLPDPEISVTGSTMSVTDTFATYQWYENNAPISDATGPSITITDAGNYFVSVSDSTGCVSVSDVYVQHSLNVNNVKGISEIVQLYPNPAASTVHIKAPVTVNIRVSSLDGKIVLEKDNATDIDVSQLANSVYMVMIYNANGELIKIEKLVKTAY